MDWLEIALLIAVVIVPPLTAWRAYRMGYQAGIRDDRTRQI